MNLPKTSFPMKAELPIREPKMIKEWAKNDIYRGILEKRKKGGKKFILHDGPPYANGHIHMGHVLNKILKDICLFVYTHYSMSWDNHLERTVHKLFL